MDSRAFETFGVPHCAAMAVTAIAAIAMVKLNRSATVSPETKHRANVILGIILIVAVTFDPILTWLRYDDQPGLAPRLVRETALPLYLCDVVSIVLAIALITKRQRFAEMGYRPRCISHGTRPNITHSLRNMAVFLSPRWLWPSARP